MKKIWKILLYVIIIFLAITAVIHLTWEFYNEGYTWYSRDYEKVCYGLWGVVITLCFCAIVNKFKHLWSQIIVGITTSLFYTALVFFLNNFWRYICTNFDFDWEYPIPLSAVMKWDITYTHNYGEYRYPMVFAVIAVLCGLKIFLSHPKIKTIYQGWNDKLCNWLYIKELKRESLSDLYYEVIKDPDTSRLVDYVRNMPLNEDGKTALMNFVDEHRDCFLIYLLFIHYEDLLTKDEYTKYRTLYVYITETYINKRKEHYTGAKVEFPELFIKLDDKFNITDKG